MSEALLTGAVGALIGGVLAWFAGIWTYRRQRSDALRDRLYGGRRDAYVAFLDASHQSAHELGKLASDPAEVPPKGKVLFDIKYSIDEFASPKARIIEIVGPTRVSEAAYAVLRELFEFRRVLATARESGNPVPYDDANGSEYDQIIQPYRDARRAYIEAAKAELDRFDIGARPFGRP